MSEGPKLFISYSWSSPEHEEWTLRLATALREAGVDAIIDKWDLREGHDALKFMEQMISNPDIRKVIMVCDRKYAEKADGRSGGVGAEAQIISPEIYAKADQEKFVAVIAERDEHGRPFVPVYYSSRIFIDLSDEEQYARNFEQLLRWAHDRPLHIKPPLGKVPAFLEDSTALSLGTTHLSKRALDAMRSYKEYRIGAVREYTERLAENFEKLRLADGEGEFDDRVIESIESFLPYRDEAIEIFLVAAQYGNTPEVCSALHRLFEQLFPYLHRPADMTSWRERDFDNFRFIVHELFLYCAASFLKYERFDAVGYFLRQHYYVGAREGSETGMVPFSFFWEHMRSLEQRGYRLKLNSFSLRPELLETRAKNPGITFEQVMQADFTLYLRECLDSIREGRHPRWWPETLLHAHRVHGAFEVYARAQSTEYFRKISQIFDIGDKAEVAPIIEAWRNGTFRLPTFNSPFYIFDPLRLMSYNNLATRP